MGEDLEDFGAHAVSAASLEESLLQQAAAAAGGAQLAPAGQQEGVDPEALHLQLRAVRRELRAVHAAVQSAEQQQAGQQDDGGPRAYPLPPTAATGGALQQAVMRQRLAALEAQERELQAAYVQAAGGEVPAGPSTQQKQQAQPLQAAAAAAETAAAAAAGRPKPGSQAGASADGSKPQAKGSRVQFELQEDEELFDREAAQEAKSGALVETERDRLIRLGVLTPFDRLEGFERRIQRGPRQQQQQQQGEEGEDEDVAGHDRQQDESIRRVASRVAEIKAAKPTSKLLDPSELPRRQSAARRVHEGFWRAGSSNHVVPKKKKKRERTLPRTKLKRARRTGRKRTEQGGEVGEGAYSSSEGSELGSEGEEAEDGSVVDSEDLSGEFDDADEVQWRQRQAHVRRAGRRTGAQRAASDEEEGEEEEEEDVEFEGGFRMPAELYDRLFDYQRTGVKWLWELHTQRAGGIIGDEMGLGKTVQIAAFLGGLHHSGLFRPTLIVCPATVLRQWLRELRAWYPPFRVALLHDSARAAGGSRPSRQRIIRDITQSESGILLTTYDQLRLQRGELLGIEWGYCILDEGHKIRNPDAEITLVAKQLQTVHRIIMTGSPIQNRLTELWSLFDFVFPGKLGTLPVFTAQFALPIQIGGYSNASPTQVAAAYKCAVVLRDLISPYLLRRRKADVNARLPPKTEQVLFCTLSKDQRDMYRDYLASKELREILAGDRAALAGIDILRKICNHPDLLQRAQWEGTADYGAPARSGKLQVLERVLRHWHEQGHKALLFTQTQQMLDIVEKLVTGLGYTYHRMDGSTSIALRSRLIDDFNSNPNIFCFLLTTRVGGLGVNLTGADRLCLIDPDWNPSTDVQARERAWRIGQTRPVTVYRLITSGTIEEKIYHRQVYKHFLTDKVLRDPRQKRFFKARDLADLFTLGDEYADEPETAAIFAALGTEVLPEEAGPGQAEQVGQDSGEREGSPSDRDNYVSGSEEPQQQQAACSKQAAGGANQQGPRRPRSRQESPANAASGEEDDSEQQQHQQGDAKILRELFDGAGVRAALDHSKIEGANDSDRLAADQEASRIARRAAEALRQSRLQVQRAPINQPTWTGRSGAAGAPGAALAGAGRGSAPRFGRAVNPLLARALPSAQTAPAGAPSGTGRFGAGSAAGTAGGMAPRSSEILAKVRERQEAAARDPEVEAAQLLAARVASFLESRGGSASSDELVQQFQASVGPARMVLFRGVLKQVAVLQRVPGAEGKQWVVKPEFAGATAGGIDS